MYTHYSLFGSDGATIRDFERMPDGGLPSLLSGIHKQMTPPESRSSCVGVCAGCLHPDGEQVSMTFGFRDEARLHLILFTKTAIVDHAIELAAEGNREAAARANRALD